MLNDIKCKPQALALQHGNQVSEQDGEVLVAVPERDEDRHLEWVTGRERGALLVPSTSAESAASPWGVRLEAALTSTSFKGRTTLASQTFGVSGPCSYMCPTVHIVGLLNGVILTTAQRKTHILHGDPVHGYIHRYINITTKIQYFPLQCARCFNIDRFI